VTSSGTGWSDGRAGRTRRYTEAVYDTVYEVRRGRGAAQFNFPLGAAPALAGTRRGCCTAVGHYGQPPRRRRLIGRHICRMGDRTRRR
jgi:hypothetical protein